MLKLLRLKLSNAKITVSGIVEAFKGYHLWFNRSCSLLHDFKTLKSTAKALSCYVLRYSRTPCQIELVELNIRIDFQ